MGKGEKLFAKSALSDNYEPIEVHLDVGIWGDIYPEDGSEIDEFPSLYLELEDGATYGMWCIDLLDVLNDAASINDGARFALIQWLEKWAKELKEE